MKPCSVENCNSDNCVRGLCRYHYDKERYDKYHKSKETLTGKRTARTPNDYILEGNICKIGCYNQKSELTGYTTIDTEDIDKCKPYKLTDLGGYIAGTNGAKNKRVWLHYLVLGLTPINRVTFIDHIDGDTWNNRKSNLRVCSNSENLCNRGLASNNKSGYKGVYWRKHRQKWEAEIGKDRVQYHLGFYDDIVEAAKAYDAKARELHKEFAYQNFPKPKLKRRTTLL